MGLGAEGNGLKKEQNFWLDNGFPISEMKNSFGVGMWEWLKGKRSKLGGNTSHIGMHKMIQLPDFLNSLKSCLEVRLIRHKSMQNLEGICYTLLIMQLGARIKKIGLSVDFIQNGIYSVGVPLLRE